ncbi:hypothetical protein V2I01_12325 [Micromonospora sp. BRA006-A]|nr:hypothetical protein [Micromonospora sp. BRA006-A]
METRVVYSRGHARQVGIHRRHERRLRRRRRVRRRLGVDGDIDTIRQNLTLITRRPPDAIAARVVGVPVVTEADGRPVLRVRVHVGARSWLAGPGADVQLAAGFRRTRRWWTRPPTTRRTTHSSRVT